MDADRALKRLLIGSVGFVAAIVTVGAFTAGDVGGDASARRPVPVSSFSHEELQRASAMTLDMSRPNADTGSQFHAGDEQLARSRSDAYLRAVEQHQADIDRMLARDVR